MDRPILARLLNDIEIELGWGSADTWSTADFDTLGDRIHERTGVQLSATTLKRVWGRIAYKSSPSPTTLDALASYLGYENWRTYANAPTAAISAEEPVAEPAVVIEPVPVPPVTAQHRSSKRRLLFATLGVLAVLLGFYYFRMAPRISMGPV